MRSLLDALQEGRLIELPEVSKEKALEYLALMIEAVPDIGTKTDLVKAVREREAQFNTGLGKGVAVPHCRISIDGELVSAIGWSPKGIDYGSSDGKKVHLIVMFYVPDIQRNLYLKEVSGLAKVLEKSDTIAQLSEIADIHTVRERLLDWVGLVMDQAVPDAKAKMIRLEAKQAILEATKPASEEASIAGPLSQFIPLRIVISAASQLVLSEDTNLVTALEKAPAAPAILKPGAILDSAGWKVAILSETLFSQGRRILDAVAFKN